MFTSTLLEPSSLTLDRLAVAPQPTVGVQQARMALAALTPRVELVGCSVYIDPWVAYSADAMDEAPEAEPAGPPASPRSSERTLRCPYCRSMTYQVSLHFRRSGLVANGTCTTCGTRGESFRPAPSRRTLSRAAGAARPWDPA
jgi:hypothetical protein